MPINLCGSCDYIYPVEDHPHTEYHQCLKYKVRLYHLRYHPDLVCAPMCEEQGAAANVSSAIWIAL